MERMDLGKGRNKGLWTYSISRDEEQNEEEEQCEIKNWSGTSDSPREYFNKQEKER